MNKLDEEGKVKGTKEEDEKLTAVCLVQSCAVNWQVLPTAVDASVLLQIRFPPAGR